MTKSEQLFQRAVQVMPGGVNSPVRSYSAVGGNPRFIQKAKGAEIVDADGSRYLDFIGSWGPMLLGHNHPDIRSAVDKAVKNGLSFGACTELEVEMAELICQMVPSIEMVRMVNSGTEAVMSALRVARGFTGRDKIIKFEGCYHGHCDSMLVKAGSGVMTAGVPGSAGVPEGCAKDTLTARYNDIDSVKALFQENPESVAAVIIEPVAANMGVVVPKDGFLQAVRNLCTEHGALLIFDEVITGFRLQADGAQGYYGVTPDLTTFGKVIGAGMPVGAYGGRKDIMSQVAPVGPVYQAGTLSGNPVAMAAGLAQLRLLNKHRDVYDYLARLGDYYRSGLREIVKNRHIDATVTGVGSLSCLFFTPEAVTDYDSAKTSDTTKFGRYFEEMLRHGMHLAPSQFEAIFFSAAHEKHHINQLLEAADTTFAILKKEERI
jgi:glutamate-1-semialdehyde 2,1-aminomutase